MLQPNNIIYTDVYTHTYIAILFMSDVVSYNKTVAACTVTFTNIFSEHHALKVFIAFSDVH